MTDFSGLQIDVRCIKCGRLPTADVTLFEMQNHLYICNICRQQVEQSGKLIRWVGGAQVEAPVSNADTAANPLRTRVYNGPRNLDTERGRKKIYSRHAEKTLDSSFQGQSGSGTLERREDRGTNCHGVGSPSDPMEEWASGGSGRTAGSL